VSLHAGGVVTVPTAGLLPALVGYYARLHADASRSIPDFGFSREKIHFQVVLAPDGSLVSLDDVRATNDRGKAVPQFLVVPYRGERSSNVKPFFCWDNTGYALGRDGKDRSEAATRKFGAFRELHLGMKDQVGEDEDYAALCRFLERWDPVMAERLPNWDEVAGLNVVFKLRGRQRFVHQSDPVQQAWRHKVEVEVTGSGGRRGISLISGHEETLARIHEPAISGVVDPGGQADKRIVAFNQPAFTSYGRDQSYNSPVGVLEAFRYCTALTHLLSDPTRKVSIGDATAVFWTDREETRDAEDLFAAFFGEQTRARTAAENSRVIDRLRAFLQAARQGRLADELTDPEAPFYVLGLSPNASRINVRFWLVATVAQFAERLARHAADLEMVGTAPDEPPWRIQRLLDETVPPKKGWPDRSKVVANLAGEVMRAVLLGLSYPQSLLSAVVRRIRAEGFVTRDRTASTYRKDWTAAAHRRAAILKAILVRNRKWEVPVALDKDHPEESYQLGRLFAVLEKIQEDAAGRELDSTIKDRYFGAASATPATVFPRLLRLHQHHMDKIASKGLRVNRDKLVGEICGRLRGFPWHLPLAKQGLFHIAYYHQRQDLPTKADRTGPGDDR
jgi:CRISPR-associated protein Csd1